MALAGFSATLTSSIHPPPPRGRRVRPPKRIHRPERSQNARPRMSLARDLSPGFKSAVWAVRRASVSARTFRTSSWSSASAHDCSTNFTGSLCDLGLGLRLQVLWSLDDGPGVTLMHVGNVFLVVRTMRILHQCRSLGASDGGGGVCLHSKTSNRLLMEASDLGNFNAVLFLFLRIWHCDQETVTLLDVDTRIRMNSAVQQQQDCAGSGLKEKCEKKDLLHGLRNCRFYDLCHHALMLKALFSNSVRQFHDLFPIYTICFTTYSWI